ncbi:putative calcium-binding protein CML44 [Senna tora]|uniref:Putative calcium-binding protein CML44 n=1 Tax=Senna tora TaxID=362788 RepID=A0A834WPG1_9FABA|nr:putative calcium-binding protein CML44 [Senna tora]
MLSGNELQRIFEKLDKHGDGFVRVDNLITAVEKIIGNFEFGEEEIECLVGKKILDLNDFLCFYDSISSSKQCNNYKMSEEENEEDVEKELVKAFEVFDIDGDGFISSHELECVLKKLDFWDKSSGHDTRTMICAYDTNFDGQLDFQEFKNMMLLTVNTDGSHKPDTDSISCGGVMRDHNGNWVKGFAKKLGKGGVLQAELWSILTGLQILKDMNMDKVIFEVDSMLAVHLVLNDCNQTHPLFSLVQRIRRLMEDFWNVNLVHTFRESNRLADTLASQAHYLPSGCHVFYRIPQFCSLVFHDDYRMLYVPRGASF